MKGTMNKLEKPIEINNMVKKNRRNRIEKTIQNHEYRGTIEELFDPISEPLIKQKRQA